jgi:hypothetical protein
MAETRAGSRDSVHDSPVVPQEGRAPKTEIQCGLQFGQRRPSALIEGKPSVIEVELRADRDKILHRKGYSHNCHGVEAPFRLPVGVMGTAVGNGVISGPISTSAATRPTPEVVINRSMVSRKGAMSTRLAVARRRRTASASLH